MSVCIENLSFHYTPERPILKEINFSVGEATFLSVLGPNGVGKSTLFRCMLGLLRGYTGRITLEGKEVEGFSARELARMIAYIPQSHYPTFHYTVFDMVLMGTTAQASAFSIPGREQKRLALEALDRMGILDFAERLYTQLSGGERQLVLIARALAQQSKILMMDEPTANLDYGNQMRVLQRVRNLAKEGYTIVQSTHSPEQAYLFSHEILAMKDGEVIAHGTPREVMDEETIRTLYGIDVEVVRLCDDRFRTCVPKQLLEE